MSDFFRNFGTPIAILIGTLAIAAAVYFGNFGLSGPTARGIQPSPNPTAPPTTFENVDATRTTNRNLYGNPDAPTTIVEFSDFECPFCARLHPTLKTIVDGSNGSINWEYRHLPLPNHVNARPAAIASECVARELGADAFWKFSEVLFSNIGAANAAFLKREAGKLGMTAAAYDACIVNAEVAERVDDDAAVATRYGGSGTPYSLIINNDTKSARAVSGALPAEQWRAFLAQP
jgi:protein-disulfide isomerase